MDAVHHYGEEVDRGEDFVLPQHREQEVGSWRVPTLALKYVLIFREFGELSTVE